MIYEKIFYIQYDEICIQNNLLFCFVKFETKMISICKHSIYCYCELAVKFKSKEVNLTDHKRIRNMFAYFVILRALVYLNIIKLCTVFVAKSHNYS